MIRSKYLAELISTCLLVFLTTGAAISSVVYNFPPGWVVAIITGMVVAILILMFGSISGAHMNPAVTAALYIDGKIEKKDALLYFLMQFLGAVIGAFFLRMIFGKAVTHANTLPAVPISKAVLIEIIISAGLMLSIFIAILLTKSLALTALIIGTAVSLMIFAAGELTGASMNPARSFGPALASGNGSFLWIYLLAPVLGTCLISILKRRYFKV